MSLGRKLFLLIGGLLCLLLAGQWLLYRSLAAAVSENVRTVAFRVGEDIVSGFEYQTEALPRSPHPPPEGSPEAALPESPKQPATTAGHARVIVLRTDEKREASSGAGASTGERAPSAEAEAGTTRVLRREWHWKAPDANGAGAATFEKEIAPGDALHPLEVELGADEATDVLYLRGPELEKSIPIPGKLVEQSLTRFGSQLLAGNLVLLLFGLLVAGALAHRMTRPLAALAGAAERVGGGELGITVPAAGAPNNERASGLAGSDEIARAVASFNRMSGRLVELDRENRRLLEAEQLSELGDVARGLAHSLRNPLNALGLSIERLGERAAAGNAWGAAGDAPADLVESSRRQIRRIDGALRSFLALASTGSTPTETLDLVTLSREVALEALQDSAAAGGPLKAARIEVENESGGPLPIPGVAAELKAILQALVVNAVEASTSTDAAAAPSVRIRLQSRAGAGAVVAVEDEGPGIPESVRERLFEPHVTTKPHGSGMGIFLAQRLATTRYGGALRFEERAGGGTKAVVELGPRAIAGAPAREANAT